MPPENITIYESLPSPAARWTPPATPAGFTSRGERELEARMECLWYVCSKVPSLQNPGLTILDETHQANVPSRSTPTSG